MSDADGFLSRWSKRKAQVRSGASDTTAKAEGPTAPNPVAGVGSAVVGAGTQPSPAAAEARAADARAPETSPAPAEPLPTLDDVALLTPSSDYSRFVRPGVEPGVRNAAMKKLFSDPHFNVMDGLDTYIDDYGKADPIPPSMLRRMTQSKALRLFDDDEAEAPAADAAPVLANPDGTPPTPMAQSSSPPEAADAPASARDTASEDDPDLRLQQDDAAGRPGPATGARA